MELKNFFALDDAGNFLSEATCYVYQRGTESLASGLMKANGLAQLNPFATDQKGFAEFAAPNGLYDVRVVKGARDFRIRLQFNDVAETVRAAEMSAGRAETARDAAQLFSGVKDDIAKGLASTVSGQYFSVPSINGSEYLTLYKNNLGVAVPSGEYSNAAVVRKTADSVLKLEQGLSRLTENDKYTANYPVEVGNYNSNNGSKGVPDASTWVMRTVDAVYARAGDILTVDPLYLFSVFYYNTGELSSFVSADGAWHTSLIVSRDGYIRFTTKRVDQSLVIRNETKLSWVYVENIARKILAEALPVFSGELIAERTLPYKALKPNKLGGTNLPYTVGTISSVTGGDQVSAYVVRSGLMPVKAGDVLSLTDPTYVYSAFWYSSTYVFHSATGLWHTANLIAPVDGFVRVTTKRPDNGLAILDQPNIAWVLVAAGNDEPLVTGPAMLANKVIESKHLAQSVTDLIANGASRWAGKTWLSLGDSITARGWYQPLVCALTGLNFVNYGVGGTTLARKTTSDTTAMSVRYTAMQASADIITVWGGVNDFGYSYGQVGGNTLGVMGDTSIDTVYGALDTLIKGLITKYPGKKVGFIITPPVSNAMGMRSANAKGNTLAQYCQAVRDVCEWYSVPYLDLHKVSGISEGNVNIMTSNIEGTAPDGLHPSMQAFEFIKYRLADFIKSI